jgi:glycosyltransferase involved in cell wall biosynthesis
MNNPIKNVDIVIPIHNEEENLKILFPKIIKIIKKIKKIKFSIVCIDDGSSDNSLKVINKFRKKNKMIKIIKSKTRKGQTICYKNYLKKYNSQYFIRLDGDNQDDPVYIKKIISFIYKNYDLVLTERKIRRHSKLMIVLAILYDSIVEFLIRKNIKTYTSSLVCFKSKFLKRKKLIFNDHRYLPLIAMNNGAKKIKVLPINHKKRIFGVTKYSMSKKIIFALPEFLFFYIRLKIGFYK